MSRYGDAVPLRRARRDPDDERWEHISRILDRILDAVVIHTPQGDITLMAQFADLTAATAQLTTQDAALKAAIDGLVAFAGSVHPGQLSPEQQAALDNAVAAVNAASAQDATESAAATAATPTPAPTTTPPPAAP